MAKYNIVKAPWTVKIARDIDLFDGTEGVVDIIIVEKITKDNWKNLICFEEPKDGFKTVVKAYGCDICKTETNAKNPIYTNKEHAGVDICSNCMDKAFQTLEHENWIRPGLTYSLKKIVKCVKKT